VRGQRTERFLYRESLKCERGVMKKMKENKIADFIECITKDKKFKKEILKKRQDFSGDSTEFVREVIVPMAKQRGLFLQEVDKETLEEVSGAGMRQILAGFGLSAFLIPNLTGQISYAMPPVSPGYSSSVRVATVSENTEINNKQDFLDFYKEYKSGEIFEGKTIKLNEDIEISDDDIKSIQEISENSIFEGKLDANGHKISINNMVSNDVRIFDIAGEHARIINLALEITQSATTDSTRISGICRHNKGKIEGCDIKIAARVPCFICGITLENDGSITNCKVSGSMCVDCYGGIDGICTQNNGDISECEVNAAMTIRNIEEYDGGRLKPYDISGICTFNYSKITDCNVNSNIVNEASKEWETQGAGLVQTNNGIVKNCNFEGSITSNGSVGGICVDNYLQIENCNVTANLRGFAVGGLVMGNHVGWHNAAPELRDLPRGMIKGCNFRGRVETIEAEGSTCSSTIVESNVLVDPDDIDAEEGFFYKPFDELSELKLVDCSVNNVSV
jgi:hypothetical protein